MMVYLGGSIGYGYNAYISMSLRVTLDYATWWMGVCPIDIGMGEDDNSDKATTSEGSKEDDSYQDNNSIHYLPP